jgi:putative sterol carrier protein
MSDVPETAREFFTEYVPRRYETVKAALAGKSSIGCLTFRVVDEGEWSLRIAHGELVIEPGMAKDVILQISVSRADFKPVFVRGAELQESEPIRPEAQMLAFKVLTVDAERIKLVNSVTGTIAFVMAAGELTHRLFVTPGKHSVNLESPECRLECHIGDFMDMQTGKQNPMQLVMAGRIRILGNAQIPMALSSVFM